jgi:hypothetical protein
LAAVALAAVFFYRSTLNIKSAENRANQALAAVGELRRTGGQAPTAMKLELTRTLRLLDSMAVEFGNEPEVRNKIENMRNETLDILYSLEDKGTIDAPQPPPAAALDNQPQAVNPAVAPAPPVR